MSTLNKLPDGSPSPTWEAIVIDLDGNEHVERFQEWWCDGKKVCSMKDQVEDFFYGKLDKAHFQILSMRLITGEAS